MCGSADHRGSNARPRAANDRSSLARRARIDPYPPFGTARGTTAKPSLTFANAVSEIHAGPGLMQTVSLSRRTTRPTPTGAFGLRVCRFRMAAPRRQALQGHTLSMDMAALISLLETVRARSGNRLQIPSVHSRRHAPHRHPHRHAICHVVAIGGARARRLDGECAGRHGTHRTALAGRGPPSPRGWFLPPG
jgi:hypothetical protein